MENYSDLLEYCYSESQTELINFLIGGGTVQEFIKKTGRKETNVYRSLRAIKERYKTMSIETHLVNKNDNPHNMPLKKTSTYYDEDGKKKAQWVIRHTDEQRKLEAIEDAISNIMCEVPERSKKSKPPEITLDSLATLYVTNDLHFGALMYAKETRDRDYDTKKAESLVNEAIDYLVESSPNSETGILADLGDLMEMDDFSNQTKRSGNVLDVDSRYGLVLEVVYRTMTNLIDKLLEKHNQVKFINVPGNHDDVTSLSVKSFIKAWYRNEPRVKVDDSHYAHKYHLHGSTLLGFAHGHHMKMKDAGEVMAMHNQEIFSDTKHRFYHFGHYHKDIVYDGRLAKSESHRNLPPLNMWASEMGFGRGAGTMKSITYCKDRGEIGRNIFVVGDK